MRTIASQLQDKSVALAVHTQVMVASLVEGARGAVERMRDEEGQGAVEYAGILVIVGLIFIGLFSLGIPGKVHDWANKAVDAIQKGSSCDPSDPKAKC